MVDRYVNKIRERAMKFARHLEPLDPQKIQRAKDKISIKPPDKDYTINVTIDYDIYVNL